MAVLQSAGVEGGGAVRAKRSVQRVDDVVVDLVGPPHDAAVDVPAGQVELRADGGAGVLDGWRDLGQEAVGVDRGDVLDGRVRRSAGQARIAVDRGRAGSPERAGRDRIAVLIAGPAVEVDLPGVIAGVGEQGVLRQVRIAEPFADAVDGLLARIIDAAGKHGVLRTGIGTGADRVVLVLVLGRHGQEAALAKAEAGPARHRGGHAVYHVAIGIDGPCGARRQGGRRGVHVGVVVADGDREATAVVGFAQAKVDHAGDGVGTVHGRCAVAQHLHGAKGGDRDGVQIHRGGAAADRTIQVHQGRGLAALAVDEHQHLVGREAAQGGGADGVGAVRQGRAREVQGGQGLRQGLRQFGAAVVGKRRAGHDVDRRDGVEAAARRGATAGDDQFAQFGRRGGVRGGCGGGFGEDGAG